MPFKLESLIKKSGDIILSGDWNDIVTEIDRIGRDKLNISGGEIKERLTIASSNALSGGLSGAIPAMRILHNGSYAWGNALSIDQVQEGNLDGPKIRFQITAGASPKSWSVGFLNGKDARQFAIIEDTSAGYGGARLVITPGGNIGVGINDPKARLHIKGGLAIEEDSGKISQIFGGEIKNTIRNPLDIPYQGNILNFSLGSTSIVGNGEPVRPNYILRIGHLVGRSAEPRPGINTLNIPSISFESVLTVNETGEVKCDGTFKPGGADYAELFESEDGNQIQVGVAVVLNNNGKIRPAVQGEIPVGVISTSPAVLGNSPMYWPGKFERDEYGVIKTEVSVEYVPKSEDAAREIEALTKDGKELSVKDRDKWMDKVERSIPVINAEYDSSKTYIPREERPEWQKVGLLGQIRITKGQPVAPSWVKIKDISDNVELWLVK